VSRRAQPDIMDILIARSITQIAILVASVLGIIWTLQWMSWGKAESNVGRGVLVLLIHITLFSFVSFLWSSNIYLIEDTGWLGWWGSGVRLHAAMTVASIMWYRVNGRG